MLVLLAIVLATASFIQQGKIKVNVPQSDSEATAQQDEMVHLITITDKGEFYYQDTVISVKDLENKLIQLPKDSKISIKIDAVTQFQEFVKITDILTRLSLDKVTVITQKATSTANEN
ncbi:MAG: TonB system transport protein ExbD [Gammaproteobacteria bacterium]|nr:MAG: TonB system transport protein ExbD [Gammaproteobacteria bacterium]